MDLDAEVDNCLQIIAAFHQYANPQLQQQANVLLMELQEQSKAWQICDQILHRPNLSNEAYHFASNTLRNKILSNFHEIEMEARISFRGSLLQHITKFADFNEKAVTRALALCIADVAVHMTGSGEWTTSLVDLISELSKPETALPLLQILTGSSLFHFRAFSALATPTSFITTPYGHQTRCLLRKHRCI